MKYETGESLSYSSLSDAYDRLVHFARRFGEPHVTLAMHAAVPLGLTPELVHFLRIYFAKAAPQIAEADLLLSPLCREVGGGAYEMYPEVRDLLLAELQEDEAFGVARINRVAEFLLVFATRQLRTERHPESRNFLVAQQWAAFAQRQPGEAARELATALRTRLSGQNPAGSLRLAQLARTLNAPLMGQDNVLLYAAGVESLALGDAARAQEVFAAFGPAQHAPRVQSVALLALPELARLWPGTKVEADTATIAEPPNTTEVFNWLDADDPEILWQALERSGAMLPSATLAALRDRWLPRLNNPTLEPAARARAAIGRILGKLGLDKRPGVGLQSNGLPDIAWIEIPGAEFQYGDESESDNKPQRLTLPTFRISRYPVTYAQFQSFVTDPAGYNDPRWWAGLKAKETDRRLEEPRFKFDNHPRDTVNWYQAIAFCRWLSWRWGGGYDLKRVDEWAVRLPTEFEWERAARGTDGRLYPYGNEFNAELGNTNETGIGQTSAVGIFPHGASPDDVEEMSGNVWEWCLSAYDKPQLAVRKENLGNRNSRVLRGGSWIGRQSYARSVLRYVLSPGFRNFPTGFRVAVSRPPS